MPGPAQGARSRVERADVSWRRRTRAFRHARADDEQVLVDGPGRVRQHIELLGALAEAFLEADAALLAEGETGRDAAEHQASAPDADGHESRSAP